MEKNSKLISPGLNAIQQVIRWKGKVKCSFFYLAAEVNPAPKDLGFLRQAGEQDKQILLAAYRDFDHAILLDLIAGSSEFFKCFVAIRCRDQSEQPVRARLPRI
jgi:hypothetical protein